MRTNQTAETEKSAFRRVVDANDTLPLWFFALVVAIGVAVLVLSNT